MSAQHLPPETLNDWLAAASSELGLDATEVPIALILKVAADVAHNVARPAAPLSTFLLGLALGQAQVGVAEQIETGAETGSSNTVSLEILAAHLTSLAKGWQSTPVS